MREAEFERKPREDPLHDALLGEQVKEECSVPRSVRPAALHRLDPVYGLSRVHCEILLSPRDHAFYVLPAPTAGGWPGRRRS